MPCFNARPLRGAHLCLIAFRQRGYITGRYQFPVQGVSTLPVPSDLHESSIPADSGVAYPGSGWCDLFMIFTSINFFISGQIYINIPDYHLPEVPLFFKLYWHTYMHPHPECFGSPYDAFSSKQARKSTENKQKMITDTPSCTFQHPGVWGGYTRMFLLRHPDVWKKNIPTN